MIEPWRIATLCALSFSCVMSGLTSLFAFDRVSLQHSAMKNCIKWIFRSDFFWCLTRAIPEILTLHVQIYNDGPALLQQVLSEWTNTQVYISTLSYFIASIAIACNSMYVIFTVRELARLVCQKPTRDRDEEHAVIRFYKLCSASVAVIMAIAFVSIGLSPPKYCSITEHANFKLHTESSTGTVSLSNRAINGLSCVVQTSEYIDHIGVVLSVLYTFTIGVCIHFTQVHGKHIVESLDENVYFRIKYLIASQVCFKLPCSFISFIVAIGQYQKLVQSKMYDYIAFGYFLYFISGSIDAIVLGGSMQCFGRLLRPIVPNQYTEQLLLDQVSILEPPPTHHNHIHQQPFLSTATTTRTASNSNINITSTPISSDLVLSSRTPVNGGGGMAVPNAYVCTNIQSSTKLWAMAPEAMSIAQKLHDTLIREELVLFQGLELSNSGDTFQLAFPNVTQAIYFCVHLQEKLLTLNWPAGLKAIKCSAPGHDKYGKLMFNGLRVRMSVHTSDTKDQHHGYYTNISHHRVGMKDGDVSSENSVNHSSHEVNNNSSNSSSDMGGAGSKYCPIRHQAIREIIAKDIGDFGLGGNILISGDGVEAYQKEYANNNFRNGDGGDMVYDSSGTISAKFQMKYIGPFKIPGLGIVVILSEIVPYSLQNRFSEHTREYCLREKARNSFIDDGVEYSIVY